MLKLYQYQVLASFVLALAASAPIHPLQAHGMRDALEAASFLFCCAGVLTGGRAVRSAFEKKGRDKSMAIRDPVYMHMRWQVQLTALVATAAVGLLLARRYDVSWFVPLVAAGALAVVLPLINRSTGWTRP